MYCSGRKVRNGLLSIVFNGQVITAVCIVLLLSSCATIGRNFPASKVYDIQIGKTTAAQSREMFGEPWRVGIEDGTPTWTYASYHYSALGETKTKDLTIRFDANNIVRSYTFNSSDPADIRNIPGSAVK